MADVSPTKWHRAHTTWFFEEFVLVPHAAGYQVYDPSFRYLFNSYYEAVGPRHPRPSRGVVTRPGIAEVAAYRRHVDGAMVRLLEDGSSPEVETLIELGLHHEQQHQELLLMDIKHVLAQNITNPVYRPSTIAPPVAAPLRWVSHPGGLLQVGHEGAGFSFDNESPAHQQWIAPFEMASRALNGGDVQEFIADGGYGRSELWLSDGWATVQDQGWDSPLYWQAGDDGWSVFTLAGRRPVSDDEPVCHLSYYEADAIARWSGARLPTEGEWESVARQQPITRRSLDLDRLHPEAAQSDEGVTGMFGNTWEWTSSAYLPYPGFRAAPGAVGEYNGKFMVNQHVLRGGAAITPPGHARVTYRNFFPPASRWAFSGARLVRDLE